MKIRSKLDALPAAPTGDLMAGYEESPDPWVRALESEDQRDEQTQEWYHDALSQVEDSVEITVSNFAR